MLQQNIKLHLFVRLVKKGDAYEGAPNSTLMLDDLKITFEK